LYFISGLLKTYRLPSLTGKACPAIGGRLRMRPLRKFLEALQTDIMIKTRFEIEIDS
jgi:hypothetical protein